jgi:hypothetical protein
LAVKLKHWRGSWGIFALEGAPVNVFWFISLWKRECQSALVVERLDAIRARCFSRIAKISTKSFPAAATCNITGLLQERPQ